MNQEQAPKQEGPRASSVRNEFVQAGDKRSTAANAKTAIGEDKEDQRSTYERFEDSVRYTVFNLMYVLLKNEENSKWDFTVNIIADMIQTYSFTFSSTIGFPWGQPDILFYLEWLFNIFQLSTLYNYITYTTFLVFFYIGILVVILILLDIVYVSYSFQQKKFKYVWPLKLLRSVCAFLVTVFFFNFIELFVLMLMCLPSDEDPSITVNSVYTDVVCWQGMQNLHSAIAVVVSLVFLGICLVCSIGLFESKESTKDVGSKVSSRPDFALLLLKVVILFSFTFLYDESFQWVLIVLTNLTSVIVYQAYRYSWVFYSDHVNKVFAVTMGIMVWGNFVLIIVKWLENSNFSGGLQIYLLGVPIVATMIWNETDERIALLNKNIESFQKGEDAALQIRFYLSLVKSMDTDRKNATILRGFIYHHEDGCTNTDCCLKLYKVLWKQSLSIKNQVAHLGGKLSSEKGNIKSIKAQMNKLLLQHARNMYRTAMRKFPTCTALRIQYAFFLMFHLKRKQEGIAELTFTSQFNPTFEEQFIIYRYQKMAEDFDDVNEDEENEEEVDIVQKYAYESSMRQFHENIMKSAQYHANFWNELKSDKPDMKSLNDTGQEINKSVVLVEQFWEQLQKLSPNQVDVMKTYARYLTQVLNDTQRGHELMARAKEATSGKQNFLEGGEGFESSEVQKNGQACLVVSGNNEDIGIIKQCNMAASRVFGYLQSDLEGNFIDKLMPLFIAKQHSKILRKSLQSPPDHQMKDKLVYAKHKSGYIFPITIALKIVHAVGKEEDDQSGGQFVGIIKVDKKLNNSNIAYLIVDKEKKIIAISSSCIYLLYLDQSRLERITNQGINLNSFCPEIQLKKDSEKPFLVQWNFDSGLDRQGSRESKKTSKSEPSLNDNYKKLRTLQAPKKGSAQFLCKVDKIHMNDIQGDVGHYIVRLDSPDKPKSVDIDKAAAAKTEPKKKAKKVIPNFFFKVDYEEANFIRDAVGLGTTNGADQINNVHKNLAFIDWKNKQMVEDDEFNYGYQNEFEEAKYLSSDPAHQQIPDESLDDTTHDMSERALLHREDDELPTTKNKRKVPTPHANQKNLDIVTLMNRKKTWSKGITTYRLIDGLFKAKESNEEIEKRMALEEERRLKNEEMEDLDEGQAEMTFNSISGNLNTKKSIQTALKDRRTITSISRLHLVMNLSMICLIAMAAADYSVISANFKSINLNFNLIWESYGRVAEVMRVAFDIRVLMMINEGLVTDTSAYIGNSLNQTFPQYLQTDIAAALSNLYLYQDELSMSSLSMSAGQNSLFYDPSVRLYFRDTKNYTQSLNFSINEAMMQVLSAIFTTQYLNLTDYHESNEDLHFITYNVYNDLLIAIRDSSEYYVEDLLKRAQGEVNNIIILFVISSATLLAMLVILFPVVRSVNAARLQILTLFIDIPYSIAISLSIKSQKFILAQSNQSKEEADNDKSVAFSEQDPLMRQMLDDEALNDEEQNEDDKKKKKPKKVRTPIFEKAMSDNTFFMQFGFALLLLLGYFTAMLVISLGYTSQIQSFTEELNLLAQAESYFSLAQNAQLEMIYDPSKPVLSHDSFEVSRDTLQQIFSFINIVLEGNNNRKSILEESQYAGSIKSLLFGDLCKIDQSNVMLNLTKLSFDCEGYPYASQGMQLIMTRYIELLKDNLKSYVQLYSTNVTATAIAILNSPGMQELYALQYIILQDSLRFLVSDLVSFVNSKHDSTLNIKTIAFVVFIVALCLAYLALWLPFVIKLSRDMWRSKSMLSIIPIEVMVRMPRIQQFLLKQTFTGLKIKDKQNKQTHKKP